MLRRSVVCLLFAAAFSTGACPPLHAEAPPEYIPGELLVKFRPEARPEERSSIEASLNASVAHSFTAIGVDRLVLGPGVDVPQALARLRSDPRVAYAEPNYVIHAARVPNDPSFPQQWALENIGQIPGVAGADIGAVLAWDVSTGDPNLKIGVLDTGVDLDHPDLVHNLWTNAEEVSGLVGFDDDNNGYIDDTYGYNFVSNNGNPNDDNQHGTHVAGIIAAEGDNGIGEAGVVWHGQIVAVKFLNASGNGSAAGAISALTYASVVGVRVACLSWGTGGFSQALLDEINTVGAAGMLVVTAAGNDQSDNDLQPYYPASFDSPYVLSVAATNSSDSLASFSNYGANSVDLAAPGVNILSTVPGGLDLPLSGTSMAAAHVAGVCALVLGRFPLLSPTELKERVMMSVDPLPDLAGRVLSGGRLSAVAAVSDPDHIPPSAIADLATSDPGSNTMGLGWTAPGDDSTTGQAKRYEVRYSTAPIDSANFVLATLVPSPSPSVAGSHEQMEVGGLAFSTHYYFAVKAFDEIDNGSLISNVAEGTTLGIPEASVAEDRVGDVLVTGASGTQSLLLKNIGAGTLDFTIPAPHVSAAPPTIHAFQALGKDEPDRRRGPAPEGAGGPDGSGYRWIDSHEPGGPLFHWIDITQDPPLALTGDETHSAPVPLGFTFSFYGQRFDHVTVFSNGYLSFTDTTSFHTNQMLPTGGGAANLVAPMWDDLDLGAVQRVYARQEGDRFVVTWDAVPHYGTGGPYTFQAVLYESGEIRFQYLSIGAFSSSATVGLQNGTKSDGLTVAFNTDYLQDSLAVRLRSVPEWLSVTPTSGRISAGDDAQLEVHFDASGIPTSFLDGSFVVQSNDPAGPLKVPTQLHVIGSPDADVSPAVVDFDTVFVGGIRDTTLTVTNRGTMILQVSGVDSDNPALTVPAGGFYVDPGSSHDLEISYSASATGSFSAAVTMWNNDVSRPGLVIPVTAEAIPAPEIAVDPESLTVELPAGGSTTRTLQLGNLGQADLTFTAGTVLSNQGHGVIRVHPDAEHVPLAKGEPDPVRGPQPERAGGPDNFGYTYSDSDQPDGPGFLWEDISSLGTLIQWVGTADDGRSLDLPIGFPFPFYGDTFTTFRACTNGFASFTSNLTNFQNSALPSDNVGVPENLLAVFWDDLDFSYTGSAYYHSDGSRLVIEYVGVPRYREVAPNTFEIILYPDGRIVYQYLSMTTAVLSGATVGIQNADRDDGLQVVYDADYVHDHLAIRFEPPAHYLSVSPMEGVIPGGGQATLTAGFDAGGLPTGEYFAAIRIASNDPVRPTVDVPCHLTVHGVPFLTIADTLVDFDTLFVGYPEAREIGIVNSGSAPLDVSDITIDHPDFRVDSTSFSVPPGGAHAVHVTFDPAAAGDQAATLTVTSNDPAHPSYTLALAGVALEPPVIHLDRSSLAVALAPSLGDSAGAATRPLVVENTGGSDLDWSLTTVVASAPRQVALEERMKDPPLDVEGPKGTVGPSRPAVVESSGGPDAFGYRWKDSEDPDGVPFAWEDITTVGTDLAFDRDDQNSGPVPLPFSFPFYDHDYDSLRVCTNGWLSLTSDDSTFNNVGLPNAGRRTPENLIAPYWDDLDFRSSGKVYTYYDGEKFIVSFIDAPHWTQPGVQPSGVYTFQALLYPNGEMAFQYRSMVGPVLDQATIGIQNGTKDSGVEVAYNASYARDSLRVQIVRWPEWMSATPPSGVTPAGGRDTVWVRFDGTRVPDGDHQGSIEMACNDPMTPALSVPVTLHAGAVPAAVSVELDYHAIVPTTPWIPAAIEPSAPCEPESIVVSSVLVGGVPVADGAPVQIQNCEATFGLDPMALIQALPSDSAVPVTAIGRIADVTWFAGADTVRLLKPTLVLPAGPYAPGGSVPLTWTDDPASPPSRYDLWYSADGGQTWSVESQGDTAHAFDWTAPLTPTTEGFLELVAHETADGSYVGSAFAGPLEIGPVPVDPEARFEPLRFGVRLAGANPARGAARLELVLPERSPVEVRIYDVRGALVGRLASGVMEPGRHLLSWNGADGSGRPAASGVYFVRASSAGRVARLRLVLIR